MQCNGEGSSLSCVLFSLLQVVGLLREKCDEKESLLSATPPFAALSPGNKELQKFTKKVFFFGCLKQCLAYTKAPTFPLVWIQDCPYNPDLLFQRKTEKNARSFLSQGSKPVIDQDTSKAEGTGPKTDTEDFPLTCLTSQHWSFTLLSHGKLTSGCTRLGLNHTSTRPDLHGRFPAPIC